MSYTFPPEIRELIDQNMTTGTYSSEEEVLQAALHTLSDYHATIVDISQGMIDHEQCRGEPLSQAMADIQRQLGACRDLREEGPLYQSSSSCSGG